MKRKEVVTFKVDEALLQLLQGISNRSDFIRSALLVALDNLCPLCKGSGILTPKKKRHWDTFSRDHGLKKCRDCHELTIICRNK